MNGCRVKWIKMRVKLEYFIDCRVGGVGNDECWVVLEDGVVRLVIRVSKIGGS